jgi:hypothetical protein
MFFSLCGPLQLHLLRGLKQGNPKTSLTAMGNNFRPTQQTHFRPVRTNIDFTSSEVLDTLSLISTPSVHFFLPVGYPAPICVRGAPESSLDVVKLRAPNNSND